jgi:methionyl-tRNA formyltransferase
MQRKTMVFMGSKPIGYECFKHLIGQQDTLGITIIGLFTQIRKEFDGDNDLASLALQNSIPVFNHLNELPPCDIIYSVQYHQLLKASDIAQASQVSVNLHMAPLPEYRGSNQFSFAILENRKEFGTTVHKIDAGMDSGDILFQKRFPIPEGSWVGDLYELTFKASLNLFKQTLGHIVSGKYNPVPQEMLIPRYGTSKHYRNEMATLKVIDLSWERDKIERHIRATSMPGFEPPYCIIEGIKVYFDRK